MRKKTQSDKKPTQTNNNKRPASNVTNNVPGKLKINEETKLNFTHNIRENAGDWASVPHKRWRCEEK